MLRMCVNPLMRMCFCKKVGGLVLPEVREKTLCDIAAAYRIDDEYLQTLMDIVSWHELNLCGTKPILEPKRDDDPIPVLGDMAQKLHAGIAFFRERHRLNLTRRKLTGCDIADADDYVTGLIDSVGNLLRLINSVPLSLPGGRADTLMRNAIRDLGLLWQRINRKVAQNFANEGKEPEFAKFVCDVIECVVIGCRQFKAGSIAFPSSNKDAGEVRRRIESQIADVVWEINKGNERGRLKYKPTAKGRANAGRR